MKHLFVPYELALKLKEKGFDEPCFAFYMSGGLKYFQDTPIELRTNKHFIDVYFNSSTCTTAPLYQQVIDWFREKHHAHIYVNYGYYGWEGKVEFINGGQTMPWADDTFPTYYKALNKAVEEALKLI